VPLTAKGLTAAARASIHDIAHAVRFLCHPDSGLITGEVLMVDGVWTLA
jgi:NAD(P)-dependent dehydrogenase (short-subunit alcohol dehydrogenase family)